MTLWFSIRQKNGRMIEIYDGRKWPVVRCGSVYITPTDSSHKVTQAVLSCPSVQEKKRRASKYTVAIGTTHGHIQVFLKDAERVLTAFDQCPAEEKCLLLIKRPKDASKKLFKAQSLSSLSMSDTQLYRQFDGTALNNPYSAHKMKGTSSAAPAEKTPIMAEIYGTEPRVRKAGPPANTRYTKKSQAPRPNAFVPIPELGIYTPEQHVLQNGTYAQHCHLREVNNNKKNRVDSSQNQLDNISNTTSNVNTSFNSSFDESVNSYGFPSKGVLRGFDSGYSGQGQARYPSGDVYHSCMDITHGHTSEQDFSTLNSQRSYESEHQPIRREGGAKYNSNQPIREQDSADANKMDPSARSHSLGDLSTGLTFSLVGQKKADSVLSVNDSGRKNVVLSSNSVKTTDDGSNGGSSALKHIRERLQRAVINSQNRMLEHSTPKATTSNTNSFKAVVEEGLSQTVPGSRSNQHKYSSGPQNSYQNVNQRTGQQPQQQQQQQQQQYRQHPPRQQSAPEGHPQPIQSASSPRRRRESEETTSSYKSAFSDARLSRDLDNVHLSNSNLTNNNSHSSNSASTTLNNSNSSTNSYSTANSHSTITNFQSAPRPDPERSPSKPKRSLPNVPLTETSERIKRFTEVMKARMSSGSSASRNYSADSVNSKQTPTRMSSVESACSQSSLSRKSSMDTGSDCEVFAINSNNVQHSKKVDKFQQSGPQGTNGAPGQQSHHQLSKSHRGQEGIYSPKSTNSFGSRGSNEGQGSNPGHTNYNNQRRISNNETLQNTNINVGHRNGPYNNLSNKSQTHGYSSHEGQNQNSYFGQGGLPSTSEETPLPVGDRSTDSGQTTATNQSYNGSALDSGYTTNNDGENDSFNSHHHHHQQQQHHHHPQHYHQQGNHHNSQHQQQQQHNLQPYHNQKLPQQHHQPQQQGHHQQQHQQQLPSHDDAAAREHLPKFSDQHFSDYNRPYKKYSNLANAHRFGSVQNISSAQAHGNPKEFTVINNSQFFYNEKRQSMTNAEKPPHPHRREHEGPHSAREMSAKHQNQRGSIRPVPIKGEPVSAGQHLSQSGEWNTHVPATRRSWDYADGNVINNFTGYVGNRMKRLGRGDERYRSTEVITSNRNYFDGNYVNTNHLYPSDRVYPTNNPKQSNNNSARTSNVTDSNGQFSNDKHFAPAMVHSYHGDLDPVHRLDNNRSYESTHSAKSGSSHGQGQPSNGYLAQRGRDDQWNAEFYNKNNDPNTNHSPHASTEGVRPRPVPISRASRLARGHTLPGGFRFSETDVGLGQFPGSAQDITLFHMTQKYDLCPLLINLPRHMTLKDVLDLKEFSVEISMVGVPGLPSSPQGQTPKIGSPGSAFTPVRHSQDQEKSMTARLKVICFTRVSEEAHKHTTLGRALDGDIIIEVNGWFCLDTDVVYLQRIVENCQGAITFTVARLKESDEKRFKGQTPTERIKGLESEISRLDELIQSRDARIQELTTSTSSSSSSKTSATAGGLGPNEGIRLQHTGTLSDVNGKIPVEGMVIGDDEYVV